MVYRRREIFLFSVFIAFSVFCVGWVHAGSEGEKESLPSWAVGPFRRVEGNPVIKPDQGAEFFCPMRKEEVRWRESDTFNPAAVEKDGKIYVLYRSEDNSSPNLGQRTSRIGLAETEDGVHMRFRESPVMYPGEDNMKEYEWPGGCEDPRVAETESGLYVMMYTSWNREVPRLCVATSRDLIHWKKYGPAFGKAYGGKFRDMASKSASVVTKLKGGKLYIHKIKGKYMMYWGERMVNIATSENLVDWTPELDGKGELKGVLYPRKGYFDSSLTECGPPAIMTEKGILLLYNGKNSTGGDCDPRYSKGTYSAGQVLFSLKNPGEVVSRLDVPFFVPTEAYEKSGQYKDGTVFIEGLVYYRQKWFLYYGCADSKVGVAVYSPLEKYDKN